MNTLIQIWFIHIFYSLFHFCIGILISSIIQIYIFNNVNPNNSSDIKIFYTSVIRIIIIIVVHFYFLYENKLYNKTTFFLLMATLIQLTNLQTNIRYLVNKYIIDSISYAEHFKSQQQNKHTNYHISNKCRTDIKGADNKQCEQTTPCAKGCERYKCNDKGIQRKTLKKGTVYTDIPCPLLAKIENGIQYKCPPGCEYETDHWSNPATMLMLKAERMAIMNDQINKSIKFGKSLPFDHLQSSSCKCNTCDKDNMDKIGNIVQSLSKNPIWTHSHLQRDIILNDLKNKNKCSGKGKIGRGIDKDKPCPKTKDTAEVNCPPGCEYIPKRQSSHIKKKQIMKLFNNTVNKYQTKSNGPLYNHSDSNIIKEDVLVWSGDKNTSLNYKWTNNLNKFN